MALGSVGMRSFERRILKSFIWEGKLEAGKHTLGKVNLGGGQTVLL